MVELRKRKAPAQPAAPEKKNKKEQKTTATSKTTGHKSEPISTGSPNNIPKTGDKIALDDFGGQIETQDGIKTTLKQLVSDSESGVVLFTYPRASTPGCTKQACMFRDKYTHLASTGLSIYGLSADSPKANTTFKAKQELPYPLLCDTASTLIAALGLKKSPRGTVRGVFAVSKNGDVLLLQAGGPDATVLAAEQLIATNSRGDTNLNGDGKVNSAAEDG